LAYDLCSLLVARDETHGRGPLMVGGPGSLNLLNPLLLRHCKRRHCVDGGAPVNCGRRRRAAGPKSRRRGRRRANTTSSVYKNIWWIQRYLASGAI